jgi:mannose-6-phosphate isomerase-like protein (cupin superfamily)
MHIVDSDRCTSSPPGPADPANLTYLLSRMIEASTTAVDLEWYVEGSRQYLFEVSDLEMTATVINGAPTCDPRVQDNKLDFQKQNIAGATFGDLVLSRGAIEAAGQIFGFLRISCRSGPECGLAVESGIVPGSSVEVSLKLGDLGATVFTVPYDERSNRFELELWGYRGAAESLIADVGASAADALIRGRLVLRSDLISGTALGFQSAPDAQAGCLWNAFPGDTLHPLRPQRVELAWAVRPGAPATIRPRALEFNMRVRGWDRGIAAGSSPATHGGVGVVDYINLFSNYKEIPQARLDREVSPWSFDAFGHKDAAIRHEGFMAVDYVDLLRVRPHASIGLHRHRDNQEIYVLLDGKALMVTGDWCAFPQRHRAIEARWVKSGDVVLIKPGQMHALQNVNDESASVLVFGGYD